MPLMVTATKGKPMRVELMRDGKPIGVVVLTCAGAKCRAALEFPREVEIERGADAEECARRRAKRKGNQR